MGSGSKIGIDVVHSQPLICRPPPLWCLLHQQATEDEALEVALSILRFTAAVMGRSLSKQLYNSLEHLSNLLGARDDRLAEAALECIAAVVSPSR